MPLFESEAIVLKSYGLSEADKIVVFLTRDHGVVRGVAKGAKRLTSRFGSSLEAFSVVRLGYFQKEERELVSISQVDLIKSYFMAAADASLFEFFSYVVELLAEFAPPADPNERLFGLTRVCFDCAVSDPTKTRPITTYFELWLLKLGGFLPSWENCFRCGEAFSGEQSGVLEGSFQLSCERCRPGRTKPVSSAARRLFAFAQKNGPEKFIAAAEDEPTELEELATVMKRVIAMILGRPATV